MYISQIGMHYDVHFTYWYMSRCIFQLVGSAPGFPHGCIDSLEEIAAVSWDFFNVICMYIFSFELKYEKIH